MTQKQLRAEAQRKTEDENCLVGLLSEGDAHGHQQNQEQQQLEEDFGGYKEGAIAGWWRDSAAVKRGKQVAAASGITTIRSIGHASNAMKLNLAAIKKGRK